MRPSNRKRCPGRAYYISAAAPPLHIHHPIVGPTDHFTSLLLHHLCIYIIPSSHRPNILHLCYCTSAAYTSSHRCPGRAYYISAAAPALHMHHPIVAPAEHITSLLLHLHCTYCTSSHRKSLRYYPTRIIILSSSLYTETGHRKGVVLPISDFPQRHFKLRDIPLSHIKLNDIPQRHIKLRDILLRHIKLRGITLRDMPVNVNV